MLFAITHPKTKLPLATKLRAVFCATMQQYLWYWHLGLY